MGFELKDYAMSALVWASDAGPARVMDLPGETRADLASRRHAPTTCLAEERPNDVAYSPNPRRRQDRRARRSCDQGPLARPPQSHQRRSDEGGKDGRRDLAILGGAQRD